MSTVNNNINFCDICHEKRIFLEDGNGYTLRCTSKYSYWSLQCKNCKRFVISFFRKNKGIPFLVAKKYMHEKFRIIVLYNDFSKEQYRKHIMVINNETICVYLNDDNYRDLILEARNLYTIDPTYPDDDQIMKKIELREIFS